MLLVIVTVPRRGRTAGSDCGIVVHITKTGNKTLSGETYQRVRLRPDVRVWFGRILVESSSPVVVLLEKRSVQVET